MGKLRYFIADVRHALTYTISNERGFVIGILAGVGALLGGGGVATAVGIATSLAAFTAFDAALILTGVSYALSPKPKLPDFSALGVGAGRTQTVRQPITTHRMVFGECKVSGPFFFMHTATDDEDRERGYWYDTRVLACHECEEFGDIYINDTLSTDTSFMDLIRINEHLGDPDQAADSDFVSEIASWTENHRARGRAYLANRRKHDPDAFPQGIPSSISVILKGLNQVYDPRDGSTGWTDNPALLAAYYLALEKKSGGVGAAWSAVYEGAAETALITAANICDETVTLADGSTEKRYTCNGTLDLDVDPWQNLKTILASMAGNAVPVGGKWIIYAGAYVEPEIEFTVDDLRGPLRVVSDASKRDKFNGARATFVWPDGNWQPTDAPPVQIASYLASDGFENWMPLNFPMTTSHTMVQRLERIAINRSRFGLTVYFPAKLVGFKVKPGDTVYLTYPRYGWTRKIFEVVKWTFSEEGMPDLLLKETSSSIYQWSTSYEQDLEVPGSVVTSGGVATPGVLIDWGAEPQPTSVTIDLTSRSTFFAGFKLEYDTGSGWVEYKRIETELEITLNVSPPADFRLRTSLFSGRLSDWVTSEAPATPTGLTATGGTGEIEVSWDGDATCNIYVADSDNLALASFLAESTSPYTHTPITGTKYYWVRALDEYGNISDSAGSVNATAT